MHNRPMQHVLHALSHGQQNLALDQVDVCDHLRNRMLHLDAGIHLNKVHAPVLIHQELDRTGVHVSDLRKRFAEHTSDFVPHLRGDLRGRRFLEQFLVAPLNTALTFSQADHFAVNVSQHLELDMPRVVNVLLHVQIAVAK